MFEVNIKWEHLTEETKKNIIYEFLNSLNVEELTEMVNNIDYREEDGMNGGIYSEYDSFVENEFNIKKYEIYLTLEEYLSKHFPFTVTIWIDEEQREQKKNTFNKNGIFSVSYHQGRCKIEWEVGRSTYKVDLETALFKKKVKGN